MRTLALLSCLLGCPGAADAATLAVTLSQLTAPQPAPVAGSPVTYRIVVENTGALVITDLTVTDTVSPVVTAPVFDQPAGFAAPVVGGVAPSGTLVAWSASSLAMNPGDTYTFTITGTVGRVCPPLTVSSTAYAFGFDGTPGEGSQLQSFALSFAPNPLVNHSPASPGPGSFVTYRIIVGNLGEVTLENVMIVDTVGPEILNPRANPVPGFTVTATASGASVIFTWTGSGIAPYDPGVEFSVSGTAGQVCTVLSVTNTGYIRVASACATSELSGQSAWFYDPGVLTPPAGLQTFVGDNWVILGWTAGNESSEFLNRYDVWRSEDGGLTRTLAGSEVVSGAVSPNSNDTRMFWDQAVTNAKPYIYTVQAVSGCVTAYSAPITATPTVYVGSVVPFGTVYTSPGDANVKLAWTHPAVVWQNPPNLETGVNTYRIYRTLTPEVRASATEIKTVINVGDYIDEPLANKHAYYYMVVPCCPDRLPSFAIATPFRPARGQGTPGAHTDSSGPRAVKVYWDPAVDGDYAPLQGYRVYRSDDGGRTANLISGPAPITALSFLDNVPAYGKQYVYIVRPVDANGNNGIAYQAILIFVAIPVNRLFLNHNQFRPARNEVLSVVFQITEPGRTRVSVFTPTGERVRTLFDGEERGNYTPDTPFNAHDQGLPPLIWDGTNERGELVSSGAYLLVLEINKSRDFRTVVVIR